MQQWYACVPPSQSDRGKKLFRSFEHPTNVLLTQVFIQALVEVIPPLEQHRLANELEPRCKLQRRIVKHGLQVLLCDVSRILHLVRAGLERDGRVGLDEEDVVDWKGLKAGGERRLGRGGILSCSPQFSSLRDL